MLGAPKVIRYSSPMEIDDRLLAKAKAYQPDPRALDAIRQVPLLFAVGISGAGKDTVLTQLRNHYNSRYQFMVSYTTRKPRENHGVMEREGVEYYFIDPATADRMLDDKAFVEVNYYADNIYGTGIAEIARANEAHKTVIKDVDVHGIGNYVRLGMNVKPVFLLPPSYEVWWERLTTRYNDTHNSEDIQKRMRTALDELDYALDNDFFYLVINDDLDKTVDTMNRIAAGEAIEPRDERAIEVARQIAHEIKSRLDAF